MKQLRPLQPTTNAAIAAKHGTAVMLAHPFGLPAEQHRHVNRAWPQIAPRQNGLEIILEGAGSWRSRTELAASINLGDEERSSMQYESVIGKRATDTLLTSPEDERRPMDLNAHVTIILWDEVEAPHPVSALSEQRRGRPRYLHSQKRIEP